MPKLLLSHSLCGCHDFSDLAALNEGFIRAGLREQWAGSKADLLVRSVAALGDSSTQAPAAFFVPGRIEVLGKHTDYCGGSSLVAAAEQGFVIASAPREDRLVRVTDVCRDETIEFPLDTDLVPTIGHWSNYPMTVARRLARNFPEANRGAEIAFGSDLPSASGMSSSSAMIIAFFLALAEANHVWEMPAFQANVPGLIELAAYLATNENGQNFDALAGDRGVGTAGGSEDHTAILCSQTGTLGQYAYCPARHLLNVALPRDCTFVIASSGVVAEKTGAAMEAYNRASRLASLACQAWNRGSGRSDPHLAAALASCEGDAARVRQALETVSLDGFDADRTELLTRFNHFCEENEQVQPEAVAALQAGDLDRFGRTVDQSQSAAGGLLGNQIPETTYLAAKARRQGAIAASAFGAGFGGSVWALVRQAQESEFQQTWRDSYLTAFPQHKPTAQFFSTTAGPAAMQLG